MPREKRAVVDDDATEGATSHVHARPPAPSEADDLAAEGSADGVTGGKKGLTAAQKRKLAKEEKKKKGANKGRRWQKVHDDLNLCWRLAAGQQCPFGAEYASSFFLIGGIRRLTIRYRCRFTHDISGYLSQKPQDIHFPATSDLSNNPPFVNLPPPTPPRDEEGPRSPAASLDRETICPIFAESGTCRHGLKCRFLGAHVQAREDGTLEPAVDEERVAPAAVASKELNYAGADVLKLLRTKKVSFL